jgi:hypothetical protein
MSNSNGGAPKSTHLYSFWTMLLFLGLFVLLAYAFSAGNSPGVVVKAPDPVEDDLVLADVAGFDGCGRASKYTGRDWYDSFFAQAEQELSEAQLAGFAENFEGCATVDGRLFLGLVPDMYLDEVAPSYDSKIFRYEIDEDRLLTLDFHEATGGEAVNVQAFWAREGDFVNVTAIGGGETTLVKWDARYFFTDHHVELLRKCISQPAQDTVCEDL